MLSLRLFRKQFSNYFNLTIRHFGAKKDGYGSSGISDKEVDKTKKTIPQGGLKSDGEKKAKVASSGGVGGAQNPQGGNTVNPSTGGPVNPKSDDKVETQTSNVSLEKVKVIETVSNHKPPVSEDTIAGRYAVTLFTTASHEKNLYNVYEDMKYLVSLYEKSEAFRLFADNAGLNAVQVFTIAEELGKCGSFCNTSIKFFDLLGKNKRFMYINDIAKKYIKTYLLLTKEEKITIISAQELTSVEKSEVKRALEENPENEGKTFIIDYTVNPAIKGGLQMYTESKFMDLSLSSRIDKIKDEFSKLI